MSVIGVRFLPPPPPPPQKKKLNTSIDTHILHMQQGINQLATKKFYVATTLLMLYI